MQALLKTDWPGGARGGGLPEPRVLSDPRDAGAVWRLPAVGPSGPDRAGHLWLVTFACLLSYTGCSEARLGDGSLDLLAVSPCDGGVVATKALRDIG